MAKKANNTQRMAITKLQPYHKKLMLEFLGVDVRDIPNQMKVVNAMLADASLNEPDAYDTAYRIVVLKQLEPGDGNDLVNLLTITKIIDEKIEEYESEAIRNVVDVSTNLQNEMYEKSKRITRELIEEAIDRIENKFIRHEYVVKKTNGKDIKIEGTLPDEFQKILDLASQRINVLLVGPSGCGKTHVAKLVADSLGLDFASQSCSAGMSESIFSGWLLPTGKGGQFDYVQSEFIRVYENGGVFLFDEIDASDSNTLLFLNQALANGYFHLPQRFGKPKVTRHKDFVAIAAANTYGSGATAMYSGRNILDGATMDRFRMGIVPMDYSEAVESKLVDQEILAFGRSVRILIEQKSLRKIMSTRFLIEATKMKNIGWSTKDIAQSYFSDWSREEKMIAKNYLGDLI